MDPFRKYFQSSIGKKQIIAATGLGLILFLIGHLAGNLFFYFGPEAFNGYAQKLAHMRPALNVVEGGLLAVFFVHIWLTVVVVLENSRARPVKYRVPGPYGERSLSARWMPVTGGIILMFVVWHLMDFTFIDHDGPRSILSDGISYGLYGVVYNAFCDPWHSGFYILAMAAVGTHLSHAIQSFCQTFGWHHSRFTPVVRRASNVLGVLIAGMFALIPVYVLIKNHF